MVGVVVISHEQVALYAGGGPSDGRPRCPAWRWCAPHPRTTARSFMQRVAQACNEVMTAPAVLIMGGMFMGQRRFTWPCRCWTGRGAGEVWPVWNLPMLLKLANHRSQRGFRPQRWAQQLCEVGRRAIRIGSEKTGKIDVGGNR